MKTVVVLLLSCAALCCAQEPKTEEPAKPQVVKRLQSVTWDLASHKLVWMVEKGSVVDGEFLPTSRVKYEVAPDEAFMAFAGEKRAVGEDEAANLHQLLDVLSLYCVESVVWWDHGDAAAPVAPAAPGMTTKPEPSKAPAAPAGKPVKVADAKPVKMQ